MSEEKLKNVNPEPEEKVTGKVATYLMNQVEKLKNQSEADQNIIKDLESQIEKLKKPKEGKKKKEPESTPELEKVKDEWF